MNQNIPGDPLDELLHQWADGRTASSERLDNLQERIVLALDNEDCSSTESFAARPEQVPTFSSQPVGTRRASLIGFLVGVTLTALVAMIWVTQQTGQKAPQPQLADGIQTATPEYARLNDDQLHSQRVLLAEMKSLFGDRLTWLAETDSRIEFGLSDRQDSNVDSTSEDAAEQLAVRVVVEKRASADSDWQLAWSVDVMSRSEEFVELAPATGDGTSMTLWAYALPDGMVAVDSELSFSDHDGGDDDDDEDGGDKAITSVSEGGAFRAAFSHIQQDRLPSEELLIGSDGVEYRVFQTVAVLDKKVG